jgi:2-polyprenyl-3-methyl-5-hydroxy-6-metoxy-1,4-benzoquinol methylase
MTENLNKYVDSYKQNFKFYNENQWYLSYYANIMCRVIRDKGYKSALSLGIGHKIVSEQMVNELNNNLNYYLILEGSENVIEDFKKNINYTEKVALVHTYFEDFITDKTFDVIEMGFVLEHVNDPEFILSYYKKYLNPNGRIFIAVPNARSLHRLIGYEAGLLDDLYKLSEFDLQLGHKRYFDLNSISSLVLKTGYKIISTTGLMLKPITAQQITQLNWDNNIIDALFRIGENYPEIANCILLEATI